MIRTRQAVSGVFVAALLAGAVLAGRITAEAQEIDVTPMSINVTVPYGETVTRTLTITNQGLSNLVWHDNRGGVVRQFPLPAGTLDPYGLAFDGTDLRVIRYTGQGPTLRLWLGKLNPATGAWLGEIEIQGVKSYPLAMDWDGEYLWTAFYNEQMVYALNPVTGQVVKTLTMPESSPGYKIHPRNVAVGGGYLWVTHWEEIVPGTFGLVLYKLNPQTGAKISKVNMGAKGNGLEYDHGAIWADNETNVYKLNPTNGQVLDSFPAPDAHIKDYAKTGMNDDRLWMTWGSSQYNVYLVETGDFSWLRRDTHAGTVPGGGSQTMTLTLDSVAAGVGVHTATVSIVSNDADEPKKQVPVTFTVTPVGRPPVIDSAAWADPNPVPMLATTVHVVASDPDGDPLTYAWSRVSGPTGGPVTFATASAANSGVTFSFTEGGSYVLRVTVSDDKGNSVSSDVQVRVAFDSRADVNRDGVINAVDLGILVDNFGKVIPSTAIGTPPTGRAEVLP